MDNSKNKITVLGSSNYDTFIKVDRAPEMGETISSNSLIQACGGKGANQAASIGKLGFLVDFIGQIGKDSQGKIIADDLIKFGVNIEHISIIESQPTGQAFILSYPNKDNSIIIVGGANMDWAGNNLKGLEESISSSKLLLMQREVPEEINIQASKIAKKHRVLTVLDVGGVDLPITNELLSLLDIISPNKTELKRICSKEVDPSNEKELISIIEDLRKKSDNKNLEILLKLGSKGAAYIDKENKIFHQNAFHFDDLPILDTTGAGDCFTASFSASLIQGKTIQESMKFASGCAYLCITKFGAMPSLPTLKEYEEVMANRV